MKFEEQLKCPRHEGRVEGEICQLCGTSHTMIFEFYKAKVKEAIDKLVRKRTTMGGDEKRDLILRNKGWTIVRVKETDNALEKLCGGGLRF